MTESAQPTDRANILLPTPGPGETYADLATRISEALRRDPRTASVMGPTRAPFVRPGGSEQAPDANAAWLIEEIGVLSVPLPPEGRAALAAAIADAGHDARVEDGVEMRIPPEPS